MVRRVFVRFLIVLFAFSSLGESVSAAVPEGDIQTKVDALENASVPPTGPFACGGLLHAGDMRALAYYEREKDALQCQLSFFCNEYDVPTGKCKDKGCRTIYRLGLGTSTILQDCSGGTCVDKNPHTACNDTIRDSKLRIYECKNEAQATVAQATCYSYAPNVVYDSTSFPFAYNCVVSYNPSPVSLSDPAGFPDLVTRYDLPAFPRKGVERLEPVPGSNATVPSGAVSSFPRDSSMEVLELDRGTFGSVQNVMHPVIATPLGLDDYPPLEESIGRLMQPPEVKLILPAGSLGLSSVRSSLFSRVFSSLRGSDDPEPVRELTGSEPDILLTAAAYLREIPLLEAEYVPVAVLIPSVSRAEIEQRIREWEAWKAGAQTMATAQGITIDSVLLQRIDENERVMESFIALEESVRRYRMVFPSYIDTLLSYVEEANKFFRESWAEENAKRLEAWHAAYTQYLPELRNDVRALYKTAAQVTEECLVPACRLQVVPVRSGTKPWELIPDNSDQILSGEMMAYLPEGPPLWQDPDPANGVGQHDRRVIWHPFLSLGSPLPDLTFNLSELRLRQKITVPVLTVESHTIDLPVPPMLDAATIRNDLVLLESALPSLTRLHPPLFDLTMPTLTLPDPKDLFLVPEPPQALPVWKDLLKWRKKRLDDLYAICDTSSSPVTFLMSEPDLFGTMRDPAATRAVTFVAGGWNGSVNLFAPPSFVWSSTLYNALYYPGSSHGISLAWPPFCRTCSSSRPQRIISQHIELNVSWGAFQQTMLRAIDTWNAQVRFHSVVDRDELTNEYRDYAPHSGLDTDLPKRLP